jgi:hypothetical protein
MASSKNAYLGFYSGPEFKIERKAEPEDQPVYVAHVPPWVELTEENYIMFCRRCFEAEAEGTGRLVKLTLGIGTRKGVSEEKPPEEASRHERAWKYLADDALNHLSGDVKLGDIKRITLSFYRKEAGSKQAARRLYDRLKAGKEEKAHGTGCEGDVEDEAGCDQGDHSGLGAVGSGSGEVDPGGRQTIDRGVVDPGGTGEVGADAPRAHDGRDVQEGQLTADQKAQVAAIADGLGFRRDRNGYLLIPRIFRQSGRTRPADHVDAVGAGVR